MNWKLEQQMKEKVEKIIKQVEGKPFYYVAPTFATWQKERAAKLITNVFVETEEDAKNGTMSEYGNFHIALRANGNVYAGTRGIRWDMPCEPLEGEEAIQEVRGEQWRVFVAPNGLDLWVKVVDYQTLQRVMTEIQEEDAPALQALLKVN